MYIINGETYSTKDFSDYSKWSMKVHSEVSDSVDSFKNNVAVRTIKGINSGIRSGLVSGSKTAAGSFLAMYRGIKLKKGSTNMALFYGTQAAAGGFVVGFAKGFADGFADGFTFKDYEPIPTK
ncbi:hypothetical protein XO10_05550 [Marinitoga sp. 1135]|uniref:hypothetical protein n=1 Tax=Marinitoga sp. 1135 TaxID=1643333 RepID=UPI001585DB6A|nr:hypothetical protein [Marinitoga sp. 1135]NUU95737.1 hypothetical protein [Marinitoga sp. 1135]